MNETTNADVPYLSYPINGIGYVLQTIPDITIKDVIPSEEEQNIVDVREVEAETKTETEIELAKYEGSIPLAFWNGVWYTFQNGIWYALQNGVFPGLNISQFVNQENCHERALVVSNVANYSNQYINNGNVIFGGQYIDNGNIIFGNANINSEGQYEVVTNNLANDFFIGKDSINCNDFVEVLTAFRCKICTYTTQDKMDLLYHFQNTHITPTIDIEPQEELKNTDENIDENIGENTDENTGENTDENTGENIDENTGENTDENTGENTGENIDENTGENTGENTDENTGENTDEAKLAYMCAECSNCYFSIESCKEHMMEEHQMTDTLADKSEKENLTDDPTSSTLVTEHIQECDESDKVNQEVEMAKTVSSECISDKKIELTERTVKCSYRGCPYKFATEEIMQQHVLYHIESEAVTTFKCSICRDLKFTKWGQCNFHLWKKHQIDVGLFTCDVCKVYKCTTRVRLSTHMKVHSETREYKCSECGKCFKQASQMRNHRVMHLDRNTLEVTRWYTSKKCDICDKMYANSKSLKNHMQAVHSKLRPYVCNVCGHASARKAMLQMHYRQHTGDKPFSCEICKYKSSDHNTLRRHIMQHTGFRPYKCPHCKYTAIQSSNYKKHLRIRHPWMPGVFACEFCSFKTIKNELHIQHMKDHEKGLIKSNTEKKDNENVEVFPGNIAGAQLVYNCLGTFSNDGNTLEANLMSSSTSADGTSQTITLQIPSKHLEGSLSATGTLYQSNSEIVQEDDETMHCFLKIPREEEESIDTGGITIPAEPEQASMTTIHVNT